MRWFNWGKKKEELLPGVCQCGHIRSVHIKGKGKCGAQYPPDEETNYWTMCSCLIYIKDNDDDNSNPPETPVDPEIEELRKMLK